ncbi:MULTISPECIES: biotin/lipoyl-containing protein [Pedobacter]|uniref:Biotin/lipoyl attachment domain-containing protein n=1 Tax=Pedobacter heparinus (strain ATCC 13125 / DSM 2366 / CIP 104194 / JCM 7457 / NBRC 12017 / NCIMB 9290 / NRRL B-14731 / HIM 762-3) TaxID=485917 RepID=C6XWG5_PEDHD|nr:MULTISPECIES: biotin/lipoyl-containing protein [Pedobacter]ACU06254.1 biotin/lipoyl attachment domain-containing protein [Pedobacter heparinus DSM 2366]MBB5439775.1 biotin carboxyl carrier protein [Pedobacter sp. AK017]
MKVKVNDHYDFDIELAPKEFKANGQVIALDPAKISENYVHVIYQNRSYNIELVSADRAEKSSVIKVNGALYHIAIQDEYAPLLKQLGLDTAMAGKVQDVKAPMPGLVLNVMVEEGQEVNKGDNLLVLEAMKMENIIKSPAGGTVKKVLTSKGVKVEKNEVLIRFS